jgi:hypothetical protein
MNDRNTPGEDNLKELWDSYREACAPPEPSPDFMPRLWERIDGRVRWTAQVWRWANSVAAAAALASFFFFALQFLPDRWGGFYQSTYVEVLEEEHGDDQAVLQDIAYLDNQPDHQTSAPGSLR